MEATVKVDEKGRITIPKRLREAVGLGKLVRLRVKGGVILVEPVKNPLEKLVESVRVNIADIEGEIRKLRREAERALRGEAGKRWSS